MQRPTFALWEDDGEEVAAFNENDLDELVFLKVAGIVVTEELSALNLLPPGITVETDEAPLFHDTIAENKSAVSWEDEGEEVAVFNENDLDELVFLNVACMVVCEELSALNLRPPGITVKTDEASLFCDTIAENKLSLPARAARTSSIEALAGPVPLYVLQQANTPARSLHHSEATPAAARAPRAPTSFFFMDDDSDLEPEESGPTEGADIYDVYKSLDPEPPASSERTDDRPPPPSIFESTNDQLRLDAVPVSMWSYITARVIGILRLVGERAE